MTQLRNSIVNMLALNADALVKTLEGVTEDNAYNRPDKVCNSAHFVFGHIVTSRFEMARILGLQAENPWGKLFDYGASIQEPSSYPPLAELWAVWKTVCQRIVERLGELTDADLNAEGPFEVKPMDKTIGGCLNFLAFHETYHIGQLGYVRRFNGLDAAFG